MQKIDSLDYTTTDRGSATLTFEGERGSKQWVWRFADGTEARQDDVTAMVAYVREIHAS